jgi:hypothetical protein
VESTAFVESTAGLARVSARARQGPLNSVILFVGEVVGAFNPNVISAELLEAVGSDGKRLEEKIHTQFLGGGCLSDCLVMIDADKAATLSTVDSEFVMVDVGLSEAL